MSNNTRQGGQDERFVVPLEASRRGAHRARVNPLVAALPMVAVAAVVAVVVALAYTLLAGNLFSGRNSAAPDDDRPAPVTTPSVTDSPRSTPSSSGTAVPSQSPKTSPSPSGSAGTVDTSIRLGVFNGTGPPPRNGIGAKAAVQLKAAGWSTRTPQTWRGDAIEGTTVYYATAAQEASARALLEVLGVGVVTRSAAIADGGIVVVIGDDWTVSN